MEKLKVVDLTQNYPQVLFLGNGLTRSNGYSWHEFIKSCSRIDADIDRYKKGNEFKIPNTILSMIAMDMDDATRHKRYKNKLDEIKYQPNPYINRLLTLPFDSILTTNYTYELEYAMKSDYPDLKDKAKTTYSVQTEKDNKYLIHTYNYFENYPPIWHIHGEARRKSSLILSHDEYARLTNKIIEFCNERKDYYTEHSQDLQTKSWIEYMILGDLYVLGFGFDFAEFDLWWIINRRMREKAQCGDIYFYEPETDDNIYKLSAMRDIGIKVESLGIKIKEDDDNSIKNAKYNDFYAKAVDDIATKITIK